MEFEVGSMKRIVLPILLAGALPAADSHVVPAMNAFTTESYKQLTRGDANLILSPFNIATALSMVLAGARSQTADEIRAVLRLQHDPAYDAALGALLSDLNKTGNGGGNELLTANGLWVQKGFGLQPAFEKTLADNYHALPTLVDFIANAEAARAQINGWTEEHTKNKIKDLFPAGSLDAQTRMVLASAIYFYGKWQTPFVMSKTQPAPFSLPKGATVQADFMNQTSHFNYGDTPLAQILEMPYAGTGLAFDVLLPKSASSLPELEKSLTNDGLTGWLNRLSSRNVQLSLPKFRAESELSLGQALSSMGMPTAFTDKADFSGISAKGPLKIGQVLHKAFVDVSEQGTEAAAATGITVTLAAVHVPEQPVIFRADHPFIFLIRDTRTDAILFIGRLMNPR
jgi:serpin B